MAAKARDTSNLTEEPARDENGSGSSIVATSLEAAFGGGMGLRGRLGGLGGAPQGYLMQETVLGWETVRLTAQAGAPK
jgi:hypothetical protein